MLAETGNITAAGEDLTCQGTVAARQALSARRCKGRNRGNELACQSLQPAVGKVATRQRHPTGPRTTCRWQPGRHFMQHLLGHVTIGGDLAADDRQQRRLARPSLQVEYKITACVLGRELAIIVQRAYA